MCVNSVLVFAAPVDELVADPPDRLDRRLRPAQALTQGADVDVDRARVDLVLVAPDAMQQRVAREDRAGALDESSEEVELLRAQLQRATPGARLAPFEVDTQ